MSQQTNTNTFKKESKFVKSLRIILSSFFISYFLYLFITAVMAYNKLHLAEGMY
ncbi:MAG: hypothetical protein AAFZ15_12275 [Bacteroidota bacterium]